MIRLRLLAVLCLLSAVPLYPASLNWNGSTSKVWSVAANWTPNAVPQNGDSLTIGFAAGITTNDLPASNVYNSVVVGNGASVAGNLVRVSSQISGTFSAPVQAMGNVAAVDGITSQFGAFDVNGFDVSIVSAIFNGAVTGAGTLRAAGRLAFNADSTFSGTVVSSGSTEVNANVGAASFQSDGQLSGKGRAGPVTSTGTVTAGASPGGSGTGGIDITGVLTTGDLALTPNGPTPIADFIADLTNSSYDQLRVIGSVTIQSATLQIRAATPIPPGQSFVIIDDDGGDAVAGTFAGAAEGSALQSNNGTASFRITYHGGDGNDVVLTALQQPTSVTLGHSPNASITGQPVMLTATVTGSGPVPAGTVSFLDDAGHVLATATLNGAGQATATVPLVLTATLFARYEGDASYGSKTSPGVYHQLNPADTSLALGVSPNPSGPGQQVAASVQLSITPPGSAPPANAPFGAYAVFVDGVQVAAANAAGTSPVSIPLPEQPPGDHVVTATYTDMTNQSQSTGYHGSSSAPVTLHVSGAPVIAAANRSVAEGNAAATIQVPVSLSGPLSQTVSVSYATADGTAIAGSDYQSVTGVVTFAPGETSKSIAVTVLGDVQPEPDEQFLIVFSNPAGAALATSQVAVTLLNDDPFFTTTSGLQYAAAGGASLTLDLLVPVQGGPFPVIVSLDAGDWSAPAGGSGVAAHEANRGYAVAMVRFRSSDVAKFQAQIADVKAAVRWLRANAAAFRLDPSRIGVWGVGAGGHLAALLGTSAGDAATEDPAEGNPAVSSRVQAVVDWYGQTDFLQLNAESVGCSGAFDHDAGTSAESRLLGCPIRSCPDAARAASPVDYVSADDPPFLLMHGTADCVVPPAQSVLLYGALRAAGVDATLQLLAAGHGGEAWATAATLGLVDAFFDENLKAALSRRRPTRR